MVIQVLTITQRFGHRDIGYFHIPDGCYFNYTELLDFVLWIYMFFFFFCGGNEGFSEGYSVLLNLLFIETCVHWQKHEKPYSITLFMK